MGGCLSICLPLLRKLPLGNSPSQTPPSSPPALADSSPSPPSYAPAHDSPLSGSVDEERHPAAFSGTELDRFVHEIQIQEDHLRNLGADAEFCSSRQATESSNEELKAVCLNRRQQLQPSLLQTKGEEAELVCKQSPPRDGKGFPRWWKPEVSDPTSPLESDLYLPDYFPRVAISQSWGAISAPADPKWTSRPWQQGPEVSDELLSVDPHVPVSYLSDESHPCPLEWHSPVPPPSLPYPPSRQSQDSLTEDQPFRSREICAQSEISHRPERKKAITAYGDTKSSSTSK